MTDEIKQPIDTTVVTQVKKNRRIGIYILALIIIAIIGAIAYCAYIKFNDVMHNQRNEFGKQLTDNNQQIDELKKVVGSLQADAEKSQALSQKQEQLMADWEAVQKNDLNKWYIAEAEYLVKLANDQLQFTQNLAMALNLLQRADQVLETTKELNILDIRKAIAENIAALQAAPQIDITNLYLQLVGLDSQFDKLPLPINPLKSEANEAKTINTKNMPWWQAGLTHSWDALSKVVIVKNMGNKTLPLVMPDEKIFLLQNLHAEMANVIWSVLHRNPAIYQASLLRLKNWVQEYFVLESPEVKAMLQELENLQKIDLVPPAINLADTIKLFDDYLSQTQAPKTVQ